MRKVVLIIISLFTILACDYPQIKKNETKKVEQTEYKITKMTNSYFKTNPWYINNQETLEKTSNELKDIFVNKLNKDTLLDDLPFKLNSINSYSSNKSVAHFEIFDFVIDTSYNYYYLDALVILDKKEALNLITDKIYFLKGGKYKFTSDPYQYTRTMVYNDRFKIEKNYSNYIKIMFGNLVGTDVTIREAKNN